MIHGDASARCAISLKGAEVVVRGSIGHMGAFMAQKGCLVVCGDAGDALGDSLYEARCTCAARSPASAPTASRRRCATSTGPRSRRCSPAAEIDADPADFRRYGSARQLYNFKVDNLGTLLSERSTARRRDGWHPGLRESATFDRDAIAEIQRAAREGIYDIRGFGAKRRVPHFDDLLFLGASVSRYPLEGYRERCATDVDDRHPLRRASRSSSISRSRSPG